MPSLQEDLSTRFRDKLTRSSLVSASRWACQYRMIEGGDYPGPWSFKYHPWLREMHDSTQEENIGMKSAQVGFSELALNLTFFNLDIKKRNVLYILPNLRPDAHDFTARAFNPAIAASPHIKSMFTSTNNVQHKISGSANLYIRGSNTRSALKSIPASVLIFDEFEEMDQENISLAEERSSGQQYRLNWKISTPFAPERGIHHYFMQSTQDHFFFECPSCSKLIELKFPDNLVITSDDPEDPKIMDSHLICNECKAVLHHEDKPRFLSTGRWVSKNPGRMKRGFHVNQLYSPGLPPYKLAQAFLKSKKDPHAEQEFFNSKLGIPHMVEGAQITEDMFDDLIKGYGMVDAARSGSVITMGIDVGKVFHTVICQWDLTHSSAIDLNAKARCKVLWAGELSKIEQASQRMVDYNVNFAVIDAMPETNLVTQWANEWYGRVRICRYNHYATARSIFAGEKDIQVGVNRTAWLDQSLGRFRNKSIILPSNLPKDYVEHIMSPMRTPSKNLSGELVYKYVERENKPDHYAHAQNYAEIALPFATGNVVYKTMKTKV